MVRAPATMVEGVFSRSDGGVVEIRSRRLEVRVCSIWAKGRYLLGSSRGSEGASDMKMSCPFVDDFSGDGLGYSHLARWVWLAITATLLALLMAM